MNSFGKTMPANLQDQLDSITARTRQLVPADRLAVGERAVEELFASGIEDRILPVGAQAPDFELQDSSGHLVRSRDLLALGPLVINFFRGRWCPYCVAELETWRDLHPALRKRGALFVAISPHTARQNAFAIEQHALPFPVLTDPGAATAAAFGLAYTIPARHRRYYQSILVNIPFYNSGGTYQQASEASWRLPLPGIFIVNPDSTIAFAEAHADFRVRPEPADVLAALSPTS